MPRHAQSRVKLAGTYDEKWLNDRFPILPEDFDSRFFNAAPEDQQLDDYRPGEEVRLHYLTEKGKERFFLPPWEVEVVRQRRASFKTDRYTIKPDTIFIEPAERRFSLVGRVRFYPVPDLLGLGKIFVGPTKGRLRALKRRKLYVDWIAKEARVP